ncbi:DUF4249 domain-containing protein [Spirosoma arboris]|uniref:DUF4249 domain-containing protein n=1 Tax=Spirosoma arboris TaxID=2682092 RepID=UPI00293B8BD1|nr:DUF4249 domain-containing protein [Spirosoma arboris]
MLLLAVVAVACVDPEELLLRGTVDVIVIDGTITNLAEPQIIRLNRSRADPLTGRFGVLPLTKISVQVVVDSAEVINCHETVDGSYQLPSDFKGQVGHAYQLRFTLENGGTYVSTQQIMPAVPPIAKVSAQFNLTSLPPNLLGGFTKGYDLLIDMQDPVAQRNYYRWDWNLYEMQDWCKSCTQGYYMTNKLTLVSSYPAPLVYRAEPDLLEDCFDVPSSVLSTGTFSSPSYFVLDYPCRTQCWEIIHSYALNLFNDQYVNGGQILSRNIGQVPFYTHNPALIEIRQASLTSDAYRFLTLFQQQTQNTGGLADTPPAALVGNVHNVANAQEKVVGYFTAGAVSSIRYWLDKKDASGIPLGGVDDEGKIVPGDKELFFALNRRLPKPEPQTSVEYSIGFAIVGGGSRPPSALCVPSDTKTPLKPDGWRN